MCTAGPGCGWEPVGQDAVLDGNPSDAWTQLWSSQYAGRAVVMLADGCGSDGNLGDNKPKPFAITSAVDVVVRVQIRWNLKQASVLRWSKQQQVDPEKAGVFREVLLCALQTGEPSGHVPEDLKTVFQERLEKKEYWRALRQKHDFTAAESHKRFALDISWREQAGSHPVWMTSHEVESTAMQAVKDFVEALFIKKNGNDFSSGRNILVPRAHLMQVTSTDAAEGAHQLPQDHRDLALL